MNYGAEICTSQQESAGIYMIGERIKQERERLKLTQPDFAAIAGAKKRTLIDWEKGVSSPTAVQLSALYEAGVNVYYILTGEVHLDMWGEEGDETKELISQYKESPKTNEQVAREPCHQTSIHAPSGFILVPHYEVQASAGNGSLIHSEQIVDYLAFREDWVRNTLGVAQKDLALISVKGDSMEPSLSNEDLILVDMRRNHVEDNAIYVLQLNGTLLVKRIQRKINGSLQVMSDNPRYDTETVKADHAAELHVLGRVVWSGRRM